MTPITHNHRSGLARERIPISHPRGRDASGDYYAGRVVHNRAPATWQLLTTCNMLLHSPAPSHSLASLHPRTHYIFSRSLTSPRLIIFPAVSHSPASSHFLASSHFQHSHTHPYPRATPNHHINRHRFAISPHCLTTALMPSHFPALVHPLASFHHSPAPVHPLDPSIPSYLYILLFPYTPITLACPRTLQSP